MTPRITDDLRDAVQRNGGKAVLAEDDQHRLYVVMTRQEFERVVYDDSDLTEAEMLAAAEQMLADEESDGDSETMNSGDMPKQP